MSCLCGKFDSGLPVIDFQERKWHTDESCTEFPEWTHSCTDEYILERGPWSYGVNRENFFNDGDEHPVNCPCGNPRSKKHGNVCFVPSRGLFVHLSETKFDWERITSILSSSGG